MRILRIAGAGIRSLAAPFAVDFASGPLASGGIFAIVGPTGAGKSTLLDAMCLALYGRTPRAPGKVGGVRIQGIGDELSETDPRTCLSHGLGEGRAEVLFEVGGRVYRSSWKVHRSRGKADGKLQADRMELTDVEDERTLADKKGPVVATVAELTGLDFEQFQRSVLLAQGQFARFLQASESERAGLLETITGQTVYRRLSIAAYGRAQSFREQLQDLQRQTEALELPSPEELAGVKEALAAVGERKRAAEAEQHQLVAAQRWFDDRTELALLLAQAEAEVLVSEAAWEAFAPQQDLLEKAQQARELRTELAAVERAVQAQLNAVQEQEQAVGDGLAAGNALREAQELRRLSDTTLSALKGERLARKDELKRARELDSQLAVAKKTLDDAQGQMELAEQRRKAASEELAKAQEEGEKLAGKATGIAEWLDARVHLKPLIEGRGTVVEHLQRLAGAVALETELHAELAAAHRDLAEQKLALSGTNGKMAGLSRELAVALDITGGSETLPLPAVLTEALARERKTAAQALSQARERLTRNELMAGVDGLRRSLVPGEPCPVCGAREHPAAQTQPEDLPAKQLQQAVDVAQVRVDQGETLLAWKQELDRLQVQAAELGTLLSRAEDRVAQQQKLLADNNSRAEESRGLLEPLMVAWHVTWEEEDPGELQDELESLGLAWRARQEDAAAVERRKRSLDPELAVAKAACAEAQSHAATTGATCGAAKSAYATLSQQRAELLEGRAVEDLLETWASAESTAAENLESAVEGEARARSQEAAATARLTIASKAVAATGIAAEESKEAFARALAQAGLEADIVTDLLGRGDEWYEQLQGTREQLSKARDAALQTVIVRQAEVARHAQRQDRPEMELESLAELLAAAVARVGELELEKQELYARLKSMEERQRKANQLVSEKAALTSVAAPWMALNDLLGSADGSKFKKFAQGLALVQLLSLANQQMKSLKPRYRIERVPATDLEIAIVDRDQANQLRPVSSLSGGETFLVSLALALGLAQLTGGGSPLQSLFIDEGFGALDQEALADALETLDLLQSEGKTIGIISHVEALRERISCQIQIASVGAGRSELSTSF